MQFLMCWGFSFLENCSVRDFDLSDRLKFCVNNEALLPDCRPKFCMHYTLKSHICALQEGCL